ncbi:MAG: GDSL-type esterase/lipase family protein [Candidatus Zixiibacteriota bacterium]
MTGKWRMVLLVSLIGNLTIIYVGYKAWQYRTNINYWLDKYLYVVDEFSGRSTYESADAALKSDTIVPGRIVFFGSQVMAEWPLAEYFPDFEAINRGVTGQRVAGFLLRFRPDVIELGPEYVVIEVSSYNFRPNSRPREILDYVISLAEMARCYGIEPVLTTCIPPRDDFEVDEHEDYIVRDTVATYSQWLAEYAHKHRITVADWRSAVADTAGYLRHDLARTKVDLNPDGYRAIAATVLEAFRTANHRPADSGDRHE